jgi:hypothetical protein
VVSAVARAGSKIRSKRENAITLFIKSVLLFLGKLGGILLSTGF